MSMPKRSLVPARRKPRTTASGRPEILCRDIIITAHVVVSRDEKMKRSEREFDRGFTYRYEYDDHYFLTDPREFIYEFFPLQEDWQLLKQPISLKDFEELPFVRSLFFR